MNGNFAHKESFVTFCVSLFAEIGLFTSHTLDEKKWKYGVLKSWF